MASDCDCEKKITTKRKTASTPKPRPKAVTKTNNGCSVKNVIIVNGCCQSEKGKTARKPRRKAPSKPKTVPVEQVVIADPVKKKAKKRRSNASPSPLVDYDSSDRPRKARSTAKRKVAKKTTTASTAKSKIKTNKTAKTTKTAKATASKPRRSARESSPAPFIEVVDYDDGYRGSTIQRREKVVKTKKLQTPKESTVTVINVEKEPRKSLRESYRDFKADRLARRTEKPGRRQEAVIDVDYYIEEPSRSLPAADGPLLIEAPKEIVLEDCDKYSGLKKARCKRNNRRAVSN